MYMLLVFKFHSLPICLLCAPNPWVQLFLLHLQISLASQIQQVQNWVQLLLCKINITNLMRKEQKQSKKGGKTGRQEGRASFTFCVPLFEEGHHEPSYGHQTPEHRIWLHLLISCSQLITRTPWIPLLFLKDSSFPPLPPMLYNLWHLFSRINDFLKGFLCFLVHSSNPNSTLWKKWIFKNANLNMPLPVPSDDRLQGMDRGARLPRFGPALSFVTLEKFVNLSGHQFSFL